MSSISPIIEKLQQSKAKFYDLKSDLKEWEIKQGPVDANSWLLSWNCKDIIEGVKTEINGLCQSKIKEILVNHLQKIEMKLQKTELRLDYFLQPQHGLQDESLEQKVEKCPFTEILDLQDKFDKLKKALRELEEDHDSMDLQSQSGKIEKKIRKCQISIKNLKDEFNKTGNISLIPIQMNSLMHLNKIEKKLEKITHRFSQAKNYEALEEQGCASWEKIRKLKAEAFSLRYTENPFVHKNQLIEKQLELLCSKLTYTQLIEIDKLNLLIKNALHLKNEDTITHIYEIVLEANQKCYKLDFIQNYEMAKKQIIKNIPSLPNELKEQIFYATWEIAQKPKIFNFGGKHYLDNPFRLQLAIEKTLFFKNLKSSYNWEKNIQNNFFINPESIDLTCNDLSEIQQNINHIAKVLKILENIEKKKNTPLLTWSTLDINQTVRELLLEYFESEFLQEIHLELTTQVNVLKKEKQQPCIPDWDTKYGLDHAGEHLLLLISIIKAKFGLN